MATKGKAKSKVVKKAAGRASEHAKSSLVKDKPSKAHSGNGSKNGVKASAKVSARRPSKTPKVESRRASVEATAPERARSSRYENAIQAYENGIKLMHSEQFDRAIRCFEDLVNGHADEPEIQERAKVLIHACEKKIHERERTVLRSADDHYNVGIAELNRRELGSAIEHLQHALKLMPKADHVLYALATANALQGNRDEALQHLRQSIHYRAENRFLATRDSDFEALQDDEDFKQLVTPGEK